MTYKSVPDEATEIKRYVEAGLDFDQHRFGLGISSEIEQGDQEERVKGMIKLKVKQVYVRIWLGKWVFVLSNRGLSFSQKKRYNVKIVIGVADC